MTLTREMMVADGIRSIIVGADAYFYIEDVRKKYKDIKIHPADVREFVIDGETVPTVLPQDVHEMDDWDKMMLKTKNFKGD